jgi:Spy/CpxP family protein refolding chaperone
MKKLTLTLTLMAITIGMLLSASAFAFGPGSGCGPRMGCGSGGDKGLGYYGNGGFNRLNLSDEQKAKIEAIISVNQKVITPIREKMFDKSVALRRLWLKENPEKDKIIALQKEVRVLRDEMQDKATALRFEIRKVLTPEQQAKLANFGWGRGPGFGPRGCMRDQGGPGPGMGMF